MIITQQILTEIREEIISKSLELVNRVMETYPYMFTELQQEIRELVEKESHYLPQ